MRVSIRNKQYHLLLIRKTIFHKKVQSHDHSSHIKRDLAEPEKSRNEKMCLVFQKGAEKVIKQ